MTASKQLLTEAQRDLLTAILNCIIPAEGEYPSAGDLQISDFVEEAISPNPKLRSIFTAGLAQTEIAAAKQTNAKFTQIDRAKQETVLKEIQAQNPAFFDLVLRQCYNGYYTNPRIQDLMGYLRTTPESYQYTPMNESLLKRQKQRAPFWTQI